MKKNMPRKNRAKFGVTESSDNPNSRSPREIINDVMKSLDNRIELMSTIENISRHALRLAMTDIGNQHLLISKSKKLFKAFIAHDFWNASDAYKPKIGEEDETGRYLLRYFCGNNKNASFYWSVIGPLMTKGVKPADLPEAIEQGGGFKKLSADHAAEKRALEFEDFDDVFGDGNVASQPDEDDDRDGEEPDAANTSRITTTKLDTKTAESLPDKAVAASIKRVSKKYLLIPIDDDNAASLNATDGVLLAAQISITKIDADGFRHLKLDIDLQAD